MQSMRRCGPCSRCMGNRACESRCVYVCHARRTMYEWAARARDRARAPFTPSFPVDTCTCVYCMVKRGPTFPRAVLSPRSGRAVFSPWILLVFWSSSNALSLPSYSPTSELYPLCYPAVVLALTLCLSFFLYFSLSLSLVLSIYLSIVCLLSSLCFSIADPLPFRCYLPAWIAVIYGLCRWI